MFKNAHFCVRGSEVIVGIDLPVNSEHLLAEIDAEILDADVFALEEGGQELFGDTISVFAVEAAKFLSVVA